MGSKLLEYSPIKDCHGQLKCKIIINELFKSSKEKESFLGKINDFLHSDKTNEEIYTVTEKYIEYKTEQLIPDKRDNRPQLLLILGNPASHSINSGMFFASESNKSEHRFWKKILKESNIYLSDDDLSLENKNEDRKRKILDSDYESPFQIGLTVFHSMPSGASGDWSGVAGIHKLLGKKALRRLEHEEKKRILATIDEFVTGKGAVVVFQKNAWQNLKRAVDQNYDYTTVRKKGITGKVEDRKDIDLICVPPTRLSGPCSTILKERLTKKLKQ